MFRKTLITGIIILSSLSACAAFAQDNAIRFMGKVSSQTCNISVNDSTSASPIILLETAKVSDLSTAGNTSTPTTFKLKLTGCTDPGTNGQNIKIKFVSNNVDASGNLKNIATSDPATNVAIQLLDPDNKAINLSTGEATAKGFTLASTATSGEAQYTAQYIATGGAAKAGNVEATVQYAIDYP
ncbi:fimbrial protein [Pantoea ananatis]|uniref:fimbrial protein n=1 Tax=Pantoea ananas TaxID=553 RepID=UPI00234FFC58|nr:fimbrial protein [Pantoea ananatis]MDC7861441.1 fimbrial protein [Pantoea ananatis]